MAWVAAISTIISMNGLYAVGLAPDPGIAMSTFSVFCAVAAYFVGRFLHFVLSRIFLVK